MVRHPLEGLPELFHMMAKQGPKKGSQELAHYAFYWPKHITRPAQSQRPDNRLLLSMGDAAESHAKSVDMGKLKQLWPFLYSTTLGLSEYNDSLKARLTQTRAGP